MRSPTLLPIRMNAADTSASSAIADWTRLTVVPRSWTTAEIETFMRDVSTTRTNIAIARRAASRGFQAPGAPSTGVDGATLVGSDHALPLPLAESRGLRLDHTVATHDSSTRRCRSSSLTRLRFERSRSRTASKLIPSVFIRYAASTVADRPRPFAQWTRTVRSSPSWSSEPCDRRGQDVFVRDGHVGHQEPVVADAVRVIEGGVGHSLSPRVQDGRDAEGDDCFVITLVGRRPAEPQPGFDLGEPGVAEDPFV